MRMDPVNLYDYEARAKQVLPGAVWDFIDAGAMDEITTRRNRTAFEDLTLRPRFLRDISQRSLATTLLGQPVSLPVFACPAGMHKNAHPDGELATAQGAGMSGALMILANSSAYSMEEVAQAASGPLWFQTYQRGWDISEMLVRRAEDAGFQAICLTVDTPVASPKERDIRNNYQRPFPLGNFRGVPDAQTAAFLDESHVWDDATSPPITWAELERFRSLTGLPLILKGLATGEDAHLAVEHGVDAILVSTHGGRQMDGTMGAIEMLPEIVQAAAGRAEVYVDSGIRRGSDVVKALALGARAVGIGRPLFWGLAVDGADGVHGVFETLRTEIDRCLAFCGQTDVQQLDPALVNIPQGWGPGTPAP